MPLSGRHRRGLNCVTGWEVELRRISVIMILLVLVGCAKHVKPVSTTPEEDLKKGINLFEKKKYDKAIEVFSRFFTEHPGSRYLDKVQFYIAESYFMKKDYETALDEYNFLITNFPGSPYVEKATLRKAQCLYHMSPIIQRDQKITKEAIDAYNQFLLRFPNSDFRPEAEKERDELIKKLDMKDLEIARIYMKLGKYRSALIYLDKLAEKGTVLKDKVFFMMGECYEKLGEKDEARKAYSLVEGELKKKAQERIEKLR